MPEGSIVGAQLVGRHPGRREALFAEQFAHQLDGRRPVATTLDEDLEIGSWLDLGILLGTIMIAARGRGLETCPQAAFADFHSIIRPILGIPANEIVICGLALGHADPNAPVNALETERAAVSGFTTFHGI